MNAEVNRANDKIASRYHVLTDARLLPERFLVVSNRLPYQITCEDGTVTIRKGLGGLVTALDPILKQTGGTWIGWSGTREALPRETTVDRRGCGGNDYRLKLVDLSQEETDLYYSGYSNRCLWPLFHYFQEHCQFESDQWKAYESVNRRFAEAVLEEYRPGDMVWIHDYHLMLVPEMLRREIPNAVIGFFLHIPFPAEEVYGIAPQADRLLNGLLGADLVGFQTESYARNFLDAVAVLTNYRYDRERATVAVGANSVTVGAFPISIDFEQFARMAEAPGMDRKVRDIREGYRADSLAIGVDRLDYTKGIVERLQAIEIMLDRHPDIRGHFTFIQISAPSRTKVHAYQEMRERVEAMVGRINGRFGARGCIPIDYRYEDHPQEELVAYYRAADLALVTPLRDGMNLVAKEYVAAQVDHGGALVLSRFSGAAEELDGAVPVNPYEPDAMAEEVYQAIIMPGDQRRRSMQQLRRIVRRNDIYWWLERYLRGVR
jgi:alpha,alpha-trehalose-phosphate synthase [UDP-forming]